MSTTWPATTDVRAGALVLPVTPQQRRQLDGAACARCPRTDDLRPGGYAYTRRSPEDAARLAWPVRVCPDHRNTGGIQ
ncbi:hypothetical protein R3L02_42060 [Streptomyces scabiei]|uniref:hypothetical protein n=1 Tax=Streptomyces scabiei TaxID=1930 RepID=UPI00298F3947|nr:hypothetical protein [Streptomyces scabiei]MDW8478336.1 hypothetical protein [Streptomyces scabiei]